MNRKRKGLRFDENGNVVCEPNAEFGADVEVDGSLTINSAKDLKTKDGSTFGGEDIPTLTITIENDKLYFTQESLMLIKKRMQKKMPLGKFLLKNPDMGFSFDCIVYEIVHIYKIEGVMEESVIFPLFLNLGGINSYSVNVVNLTTGEITQNNIAAYPGFSLVDNSLSLGDDTFAGYTPSLQINTINGIPAIQQETGQNIQVQSTLYRHTVTFSESGLGYTNRFTAYSEKNTLIESIQDLITVFGDTQLMCTGTIESGANPCVGINIGSTADTILFLGIAGATQKLSSWYSTGPDSTLTIIDNVTAM